MYQRSRSQGVAGSDLPPQAPPPPPPQHSEVARVREDTPEQAMHMEGVYIISVAARLLDMHPQTLRKYERLGLIRPGRRQETWGSTWPESSSLWVWSKIC